MALIAIAADKGSPGVTTSALALAAVWPRPVLLAECDPAGGDLAFRLPGADGASLDTRRGLLSAALAARRGMAPGQVWEHVQKVHGGLDVLTGVTNAEQGAGLEGLWGTVGAVLAGVPQADVIADCGRIGVDGTFYDLLAQAAMAVLVSGVSFGEIIRLRERAAALASGLARRGRGGVRIPVVIVASTRHMGATLSEVSQALGKNSPAVIAGGLAHDPRSAESLGGEWGGKLDKSMLIRTAREVAATIAGQLPPLAAGPDAGAQGLPQAAAARQSPVAERAPGPARPAPAAPPAPRDQARSGLGEYPVLVPPAAPGSNGVPSRSPAIPAAHYSGVSSRPPAIPSARELATSDQQPARNLDPQPSARYPDPQRPSGYPDPLRAAGDPAAVPPRPGGEPDRAGPSASRGRHAEPAPSPADQPEHSRDDSTATWPGQAAAAPGRWPDTSRDR